jgi:hypothetical protein
VRRYKTLTIVSLLVSAVGLFLLTNIRPDTPMPLLWLWMAITGLGVGPTFAVFTLVVQNTVPVRALGSATSSLTLFQQVGGTIGLAVTGTVFGSTFIEEMPRQLQAAGVPAEVVGQVAASAQSSFNQLTSVGDLCSGILSQLPPQVCPTVENAIFTAFSIGTGATFVVGIATSLIAAAVVLIVLPAGRIGHQS